MASSLVAIGRDFGKVDTDAGGLARYSMKLQVPPGMHHDSEPEISLEYCQGTPNSSLGVGWALGGISCIRRAPSNLAFDGVNPPPAGYDVLQPKLTLDGAELLNTQGDYGSPNAVYGVEVDNDGRSIMPVGQGFIVRDSTGRRSEYGTTEDSRVWSAAQKTVREWRLTRIVDYYGNAINYSYSASPQGSGTADSNACYISTIRYTSNERTGLQGSRIISFEYSSRPDIMIQTIQGDKCTWASRLSAISFGVTQGADTQYSRSYELDYVLSEYSGDSCLTSITETSIQGSKKLSLMPSTFTYIKQTVPRQDLFKPGPSGPIFLPATTNNVALFTMNISGRCLADLACIRYDRSMNRLSIKTYLANRRTDGTISWQASDGPGSEATLQTMEIRGSFPSILTPDINNDGRADIVIPFAHSDGSLRFSISQCVGTGYKPATAKTTNFRYSEDSKFMTIDRPDGGCSIIQIFTNTNNKLAFRNFRGITDKGEIGMRDAVASATRYDNSGTINWVQIVHTATGAKSLLRVWAEGISQGRRKIQATTFTMNAEGVFAEQMTSVLIDSISAISIKYSVLPCDVNADGTQDLILATAEYVGDKMALTYYIFLGDGQGNFTRHGSTIERRIAAPPPMNSPEHGLYHLTNLNGSNYPTLSYVYQERYTKAYRCLAVDGRSDGTLSDVKTYNITTGDPLLNKAEILATDLNGNGIGDWLFYTLENDAPRVLPIYNRSNVVDFLSSAQDPMGLRTTLTYGSLADDSVYASGVDWRNYRNDDDSSYPVLAAPNYVVTGLEHQNDSSVNSFNYRVMIKKTYAKARVNFKGRGWLGFGEISTLNVTDSILTTERYLQTWPLAGAKYQIDVQSTGGEVLKSLKTAYRDSFVRKGQWNIYRTDRTSTRTDMLEAGAVVRSNVTQYEYDGYGNMTLQSHSETQRSSVVFQSWKRCAYTVIDGVTSVLLNQKFSSLETNKNLSKFEPGDYSLTVYDNEKDRAALKGVLTWSTDIGDFTRKSYKFDEYGRLAETVDAAGLKTSYFYDSVFQSYQVKVTEEGMGVRSSEYFAYDMASGNEVAKWETNGNLTCHKMDAFGRIVETRNRAVEQSQSTVKATEFLLSHVTDSSLAKVFSDSHLDPRKEVSYGKQTSPKGATYLFARAIFRSKDGVDGQHELTEYLDCVKQSCKKSSRDADDTDGTWIYREYNTSGQPIFESFPQKVAASVGLDWTPDRTLGLKSTFDILGRPTSSVRPAHGQQSNFVVTATTHLDGGARIREKRMTAKSASFDTTNPTQLEVLERRYIRIAKDDEKGDKEELVVENIDENNLRSTFQYNIAGKLVQSVDPANQTELRTYNSNGDLIKLDNVYQNPQQSSSPSIPALSYTYDAARQRVSQKNAAGEVITYQRDAKGRPLVKLGQDGRTIKYEYDREGVQGLSSVTIYPVGTNRPFESKFEYVYDHRGRVRERILTLGDQSTFKTSLFYDWQDQVVRKVQPDNVVVTHDYRGSTMRSSTLSDNSASTWMVKAEDEQYSAYGRPERLRIKGSGMKSDFLHIWEYDSQGFPLTHSLSSSSTLLVKEHYFFNDMDQLKRKHEFISGSTMDYEYAGKRLSSSQSGDGKKNVYTYDATGTLKTKRDVEITYTKGRATGLQNGTSQFDVSYDNAGRMVRRDTQRSSLLLSYNSFGALQSWKDSKTSTSADFLVDHDGEAFQRKHSDGSSELFIGNDLSISIQADGKRVVRHHLIHDNSFRDTENAGHIVGTITNVFDTAETKRPLGNQRKLNVQFTDTKGNVTQIFSGEDGTTTQKLEYDDFGMVEPDTANKLDKDNATTTYEGNYLDTFSGLLDFGARWYDPFVGRFIIPDDILDTASLLLTDGLNRLAFENNDPINNIDPTGHWSWSSILGLVVGVVMVVAAVALTVVTGGAAAPLMGAIVGALAAGGAAGIMYSVKHKDEEDAGKFWSGWCQTVALNAVIGAVSGGLGAVAGPARVASAFARIMIKAAIAGTASVVMKAVERSVDNNYYGQHKDLWEGWTKTFMSGAIVGGIFGAFSSGKPSTSKLWNGTKAVLKPGGKLGKWSVTDLGFKPWRHIDWSKPF